MPQLYLLCPSLAPLESDPSRRAGANLEGLLGLLEGPLGLGKPSVPGARPDQASFYMWQTQAHAYFRVLCAGLLVSPLHQITLRKWDLNFTARIFPRNSGKGRKYLNILNHHLCLPCNLCEPSFQRDWTLETPPVRDFWELFGIMGMFYIFIVVMVTWLCMVVKLVELYTKRVILLHVKYTSGLA